MVNCKSADIIFYEAFEEEQALLKEKLPSGINAAWTAQTIQESGHQDLPAKLISIRTQSKIPQAWARDLQGVLSRSTGFDHLALFRQNTKTRAVLGYLPRYCARAVAEQAILLILALSRKLQKQTQQLARFNRDGLTGAECRGKNLLVIGVGNIGQDIVEIAKGLGMNVAGVDIHKRIVSLEYRSLLEGLAWADVIVCALRLTLATTNMLNFETLRQAKKGALFVNIARGEIAPLTDLTRLLDQGTLGGLALDVFENEQDLAQALRGSENPNSAPARLLVDLQKRDNVILTPHNAFNTRDAVEQKTQQTIASVMMFLERSTFLWNIPGENEC